MSVATVGQNDRKSDDADTSQGIYSMADVARYVDVPVSTIGGWIRGRARAEGGLLAFDQLVTILFVRALRSHHVRLRDIRVAEQDLRERTGQQYPFAYEALWVAGLDVLVRVDADPDAWMAANRRGQLAMPGVVEPVRVQLPSLVAGVRDQLSYQDGRVAMWRPVERVTARPAVQFGLTCIEGTRLTTRSVFEASEAGDDHAAIAQLFEVAEADVARAVAWERRLAV